MAGSDKSTAKARHITELGIKTRATTSVLTLLYKTG